MSDIAIRVENLGKRYRIGGSKEAYGTLRDSLVSLTQAPLRALRNRGGDSQEFWALRDVSFEIKRGEVVGIIGRNGAGKSTLLKILSRITEPTAGRAEIRGRVGSLLEVGTGFHPELTGRENIYLNGAILGMTKRDIDRRFDEIVEFAEIEQFLDTPVKRYSSGMYMRLAFSIAAHLEPDILIVDEVLAVGDAEFQKKSLGKMGAVAGEGRTVLLVSHNLHAISGLCSTAIWVDRGRIRSAGSTHDVVTQFTTTILSEAKDPELLIDHRAGPAVIRDVRIVDVKGAEREWINVFEPFAVEITIVQRDLERPIRVVFSLQSLKTGTVALVATDWDSAFPARRLSAGEYTLRCTIPGNLLNAGSYGVTVGIDEPRVAVYSRIENIRVFVVSNPHALGDGLYGDRDGCLSPYREWALVTDTRG